jgi:hypothetical protein
MTVIPLPFTFITQHFLGLLELTEAMGALFVLIDGVLVWVELKGETAVGFLDLSR